MSSVRDRAAIYARKKAKGDPELERGLRKAYQAGAADKLLTLGIELHDQAVTAFGQTLEGPQEKRADS